MLQSWSRSFLLPSGSGGLPGSGWRCQWVWRDTEFGSGCFCWFCHRRAHTDAPVSALPFLLLKSIGDIQPETSRGMREGGGASTQTQSRTHLGSPRRKETTLLLLSNAQQRTFVSLAFPVCNYVVFYLQNFQLHVSNLIWENATSV